MQKIDKNSRATIEFTVEWQGQGVRHRDSLWANQVNFWRDSVTPELAQALTGKGEGDRGKVKIPAQTFSHPYRQSKLVQIPQNRFYPPAPQTQPLVTVPGRFYPQGFLHGVSGVFEASVAPARFIKQEGTRLLFDLNHPLAGYDLTLAAEIIKIQQTGVERGGRCEDWLERVCSDGPGMQSRYQDIATDFFAANRMQRLNESSDHLFYERSRMVQHLDSTARETIRKQYGEVIAPGSKVLDLMGSWDSHLPDTLFSLDLTVLGMNTEELTANKKATKTVCLDLNENPILPFADNSFNAVVCTASVEYLTDPLAVFSEIKRILDPGGIFALAFSNRCFPPKAIQIWSELHEFERLGMVLEMFHRTTGFNKLETLTRRGLPRPEDDPHQELLLSDPVFMVWGTKS